MLSDSFEAREVLVEATNLVYIVLTPKNPVDSLGSGYALINLSPKTSVSFWQSYLNSAVFDNSFKSYPRAALGFGYINFVQCPKILNNDDDCIHYGYKIDTQTYTKKVSGFGTVSDDEMHVLS